MPFLLAFAAAVVALFALPVGAHVWFALRGIGGNHEQ